MDMIDKLWKKLIGIDTEPPESVVVQPVVKKTEKEIATENKEPWVSVLTTHVNKENIRNGFFELDWNDYFIVQLRAAGYRGDHDEELIDQWFTELCRNVAADSGVDMSQRGSGYINRALRDDGKSEIY
jgi:hypothetical protein